MRNLILTLIITLPLTLWGQDRLIKKDGFKIDVIVKEINNNDVKYVKWDNLEGPIYTISKSKLFKIEYRNGTSEFVNYSSIKKLRSIFNIFKILNANIGVTNSNLNNNRYFKKY